jgi:hypothetical protein
MNRVEPPFLLIISGAIVVQPGATAITLYGIYVNYGKNTPSYVHIMDSIHHI